MGDHGFVRRVALVLVAVLAAACVGAADDSAAPAAVTASTAPEVQAAASPAATPTPGAPPVSRRSTTPAERPSDGGEPAVVGSAPRDLVAIAVDDLAERLGVPSEAITVTLAQVVTWPDYSIGCPLRDRQYFDRPVQGTRVHLTVDGELYRYHTGGERSEPFLCDISLKSELPIRRLEP